MQQTLLTKTKIKKEKQENNNEETHNVSTLKKLGPAPTDINDPNWIQFVQDIKKPVKNYELSLKYVNEVKESIKQGHKVKLTCKANQCSHKEILEIMKALNFKQNHLMKLFIQQSRFLATIIQSYVNSLPTLADLKADSKVISESGILAHVCDIIPLEMNSDDYTGRIKLHLKLDYDTVVKPDPKQFQKLLHKEIVDKVFGCNNDNILFVSDKFTAGSVWAIVSGFTILGLAGGAIAGGFLGSVAGPVGSLLGIGVTALVGAGCGMLIGLCVAAIDHIKHSNDKENDAKIHDQENQQFPREQNDSKEVEMTIHSIEEEKQDPKEQLPWFVSHFILSACAAPDVTFNDNNRIRRGTIDDYSAKKRKLTIKLDDTSLIEVDPNDRRIQLYEPGSIDNTVSLSQNIFSVSM